MATLASRGRNTLVLDERIHLAVLAAILVPRYRRTATFVIAQVDSPSGAGLLPRVRTCGCVRTVR